MTDPDKIASDLRTLAEFYEKHPEHPKPIGLQVLHEHVKDAEELKRYAGMFGGIAPYGPDGDQIHHQLPGEALRIVMIIRTGIQ